MVTPQGEGGGGILPQIPHPGSVIDGGLHFLDQERHPKKQPHFSS